MFLFPLLLAAQQFPDRLVLTNGKSYDIKLNEISTDKIQMSYKSGEMAVSFITIDSLFVGDIGLIFTGKSGFVSWEKIFTLKNVIKKDLKSEYHEIYLNNGKSYFGQLLKVTNKYLITEMKDTLGNYYYKSFPKKSVASVIAISGELLYANGKLKVDLEDYYTPHNEVMIKSSRKIEKYPRFGIEVSYSSTITKLNDLDKVISEFCGKVGDVLPDKGIKNKYNFPAIGLVVDLSSHFSLSFNCILDWDSTDDDSFTIVYADVKYFPFRYRIRPWIGAGYSTLSTIKYMALEHGSIEFSANPHGILLGVGFEFSLIDNLNLVSSYRYMPFYNEKIIFNEKDMDGTIDLQAQHIAVGFNYKF
jgi:opacity protein-like surface antigen